MKNFTTKIFVGLLSFIVGISAFYLISSVRLFATLNTSNSVTPNLPEKEILAEPKKELSHKVEIRFVRFVQENTQIKAEFEITNGTTENIYFYGYDKNFYAYPTFKRDGKVVPPEFFRCGDGITEQELSSGETVLFRVLKSQATYEPRKNSWRETDKPTQIGFAFEIGNKDFIEIGKSRKEIFWSEEIKFPK